MSHGYTTPVALVRSDFLSLIYPENGGELVFGLVSPMGTDQDACISSLKSELASNSYEAVEVSLSGLIQSLMEKIHTHTDEFTRITNLQAAGSLLRKEFGTDVLGLAACREIQSSRNGSRKAYIIRTIKHPDEAALLRAVYGHGFFLIALHMPHEDRLKALMKKGMTQEQATKLIGTDEKEPNSWGQNTRDAYELADFFLSAVDLNSLKLSVSRFLSLVFSELYETPTFEEFGMFMAYSSALRSSDLSRQVGAAVFDEHRDLLAVGCNEVPKFGGGTYWPDHTDEQRDFKNGSDPNERLKRERFDAMFDALQAGLRQSASSSTLTKEQFNKALSESGLRDLTEFGRSVHAEMDALMSCARRGISTANSVLFATTFPCHNCARHIIAAGVRKVVYIEPYTKSEAYRLHLDSIDCPSLRAPKSSLKAGQERVTFAHFAGIAPRRFADFFGMRLITGARLERKDKQGKVHPRPEPPRNPRLPLSLLSYVNREEKAVDLLDDRLTSGKVHDKMD